MTGGALPPPICPKCDGQAREAAGKAATRKPHWLPLLVAKPQVLAGKRGPGVEGNGGSRASTVMAEGHRLGVSGEWSCSRLPASVMHTRHRNVSFYCLREKH